jgi:WXG100 family type VII secretion target
MATYGVNPNNLLDTGDELRAATKAIEGALSELDTAVNTYISANTGQTAEAFRAAQAKWQAGVQEMNASLNTGATALDQISQTYTLTDQQGAASFS